MQNDKVKFKIEFKGRLYNFVLKTIKFLEKLPKDKTTLVISDQLLRSVTSIIGNYIEAQAASSKKDFINFFNHALKSANESKLWFCLLRDTGKSSSGEINSYLEELNEISKILASSILTMKGKK